MNGVNNTVQFYLLSGDDGAQLIIQSDVGLNSMSPQAIMLALPSGLPIWYYNPGREPGYGRKGTQAHDLQVYSLQWIDTLFSLVMHSMDYHIEEGSWTWAVPGATVELWGVCTCFFFGDSNWISVTPVGPDPNTVDYGNPASVPWGQGNAPFSILINTVMFLGGVGAITYYSTYTIEPRWLMYYLSQGRTITQDEIDSVDVLTTALGQRASAEGTIWGGRKAIAQYRQAASAVVPGPDGTVGNMVTRYGKACEKLGLQRIVLLSKDGDCEPGIGTVRDEI